MDFEELSEKISAQFDDLRDRSAEALKADGESVFAELRKVRKELGETGDHLAEQLEQLSDEVDDRFDDLLDAERGTTWPRRLFWLALGAGVGTAVAYLMDPDRGHARRTELSDQVGARARDLGDEAGDQAKVTADRAKGSVIETAKQVTPEDVPDDPKLLEARIKSDVFGHRDDVHEVVLRVDGPGKVALKGTVPSAVSERELVASVSSVEGVTDVRSELTVRG